MFPAKGPAAEFVADLRATKSTSITAAVVLACTFLPMSGGAIKPYELQELGAGVVALMNGHTSTPTIGRAYHPEWGDGFAFVSTPAATPAPSFERVSLAAESESDMELAGAMLEREAELTPVIQTFDEPEPLYVQSEEPVLEEPDLTELPEIEAEELIELELG